LIVIVLQFSSFVLALIGNGFLSVEVIALRDIQLSTFFKYKQ